MVYKTLSIKQETYGRLSLYKHAGMSFDDVLNSIMDAVPEKEFYNYVISEHRQRMKMVREGDVAETEDLDEALEES
jgi:predicted CopG family antitoxin